MQGIHPRPRQFGHAGGLVGLPAGRGSIGASDIAANFANSRQKA